MLAVLLGGIFPCVVQVYLQKYMGLIVQKKLHPCDRCVLSDRMTIAAICRVYGGGGPPYAHLSDTPPKLQISIPNCVDLEQLVQAPTEDNGFAPLRWGVEPRAVNQPAASKRGLGQGSSRLGSRRIAL